MKLPLLLKAYKALRKGWKKITPEAQKALRSYVKSQKKGLGYMNAGGMVEPYYTQFGVVLEAVLSPWKIPFTPINLKVTESLQKEDVYGEFFRFIGKELKLRRPKTINVKMPESRSTNAVCCMLSMQHQIGQPKDSALVEWLKARQDVSGGFYASEVAPVPDLLTTAVCLFTMSLIGEKAGDATDFINAHWLDNGGFAPTILDEYSDVEYVFYGLLALGSINK